MTHVKAFAKLLWIKEESILKGNQRNLSIKKNKKKIQDFQNFPKKREKFSKKKKFWTRDIGLPSDFFKKGPIFFFQGFQVF